MGRAAQVLDRTRMAFEDEGFGQIASERRLGTYLMLLLEEVYGVVVCYRVQGCKFRVFSI